MTNNKYIIELSESYGSQIDDGEGEYVYASIDDLDGKILTMIDSDDIHSYTPIGSTEFVNKFRKLY
jgi:hypothetical protein